MKKLVLKLEKKPLVISIVLVIFQTFLFYFSRLFQAEPNIIGGIIDTKIPFVNYFIIPYYIWYFLLFFMPYYFYKKDKKTLYKYIIAYVLCAIVANIIFIIYPTTVIRPTLENTNILNILTNIVYTLDTPAINCFPSMHCAIAMLYILTTLTSKKVTNSFKLVITLISILIMLSTLFTKQHVFIDLIAGNLLMTLIFLLFSNNKHLTNIVNKMLRD